MLHVAHLFAKIPLAGHLIIRPTDYFQSSLCTAFNAADVFLQLKYPLSLVPGYHISLFPISLPHLHCFSCELLLFHTHIKCWSSSGLCPQVSPLLCVFNLDHLVHSCCFSCHIYRQPWNLYLKLRILFRSSEWYSKMSTRSLRRLQTSCSMVPKIQLLFSIPQTLAFCISVNSPLPTQMPEEKPGCPSLCCSFLFFISNQPSPALYVPVPYHSYQYLSSTLSILSLT